MNPSEEARQSVTQKDIDYAVGLVKQGALPAEVRDKLMEKSLSEDVASTVAHNCVRRSYSEAAELLDMGLTAEQAVHALRDKGFSEGAATALIHTLLQKESRAGKRAQGPAGVLAMVLGGLVFIIGAGLFIGNVTRLFPTIPLAGYLTMAAGAGIFGWGQRRI